MPLPPPPTPGSSGVSEIIAGTNVTVTPATGKGDVTVNSTGGSLVSGGAAAITGPATPTSIPNGTSVPLSLGTVTTDPTDLISVDGVIIKFKQPGLYLVAITMAAVPTLTAGGSWNVNLVAIGRTGLAQPANPVTLILQLVTFIPETVVTATFTLVTVFNNDGAVARTFKVLSATVQRIIVG